MARGRLISTEIWKSEKIAKFDPFYRLQWIGLITTADDQGRGRAHPGLVRSAIFPIEDIDHETITAGMQALAEAGLIILYEAGGKQLYQIMNWWEDEHQGAMRWAWPSKHPAPDGWIDRLCYRQGNRVIKENWDDSTDSGDSGEDDCPSDDNDPTTDPSSGGSGTTMAPMPHEHGNGKPNDKSKSEESPKGAGAPPPPKPPAKPAAKPTAKKTPEAVKVFRANAHRYPAKSWYADVDKAVGDDETNLDFWGKVVKAWVGLGWNPTNVKGMLEFYGRREIPAVRGGNGRSGTNRTSNQTPAKPPAAPVDAAQVERDRAALRAHRAKQRAAAG